MRMIDIIEKKRDGNELTKAEINWFIQQYTAEKIPDYQIAALLMCIYYQGMSREETVNLTIAMTESGDQLNLQDVAPFTIDKHSSGGVGDKTTLVVQPLVAAAGIPVGKMSGRGLGSSGGTLDKMESFSGWSCAIPLDQFKKQLKEIGLVLAGQTADLAPADGKLYALRDVTGTVASLPLIAGSIMSKKLAAGTNAIVLDVKTGSGAFMATVADAKNLARIMVDIGNDAGRHTVALISDMNQPLGHAVGNALEVKEAIDTLQGGGPADFWAHCLEVAAHMVLLSGKVADLEAAKSLVTELRNNGQAWQKFRAMVLAQGGNEAQLDDPSQLPQAQFKKEVVAPHSGYISGFDNGEIGWSCVRLGAGRQTKADPIEHGVGIIIPCKVGDYIEEGALLFTLFSNDLAKQEQAEKEILAAIHWSDKQCAPLPHFYGVIQ